MQLLKMIVASVLMAGVVFSNIASVPAGISAETQGAESQQSECVQVDKNNSLSSRNLTDYSQSDFLDEYERLLNDANSDYDRISSTCGMFLIVARAYVQNNKLYDPYAFISQDGVDHKTIAYHMSDYCYKNQIKQLLGWHIYRDSITVSPLGLTIKNNIASMKMVECYQYCETNGFDAECCHCRECSFTLVCNNGVWQIAEMTTNDPQETAEGFVYEPIDVNAALESMKYEISHVKPTVEPIKELASDNDTVNVSRDTLYHWTYSPSDAATYAQQYYSTYNTLFNSYALSGGDCQNFASQCVWAGFGGSSSKTSIPAVSTSLVGSSSSRVWCEGQASTYYGGSLEYLNYSWIKVRAFANLIDTSSYTQVGPLGWVHYGSLANACIGDVIQWDTSGSPSSATVDHAMFVSDVTGTKGQRTMENIFVCAHTADTSYASEPLVDYAPCYMDSSYFANERISSAYYPEAQ